MRTHPSSRGFTLTEILVVIGIIVVVLGISIPAFNVLRGSNSISTARNQISALLGVARVEAMGLEQVGGVMFYIDPATQRVGAALVRQAPRPVGVGSPSYDADPNIDVYLELAPDREPLLLPAGVGIQTYINCAMNTTFPGGRGSDGFLGFNVASRNSQNVAYTGTARPSTRVGGVILFDRLGTIVAKRYAFRTNRTIVAGSVSLEWTPMGELLYGVGFGNASSYHDVRIGDFNSGAGNIPSQFGFVLYDSGIYNDIFGDNGLNDRLITGDTAPYGNLTQPEIFDTTEGSEERWLDRNGLPLVVNRYNASLISTQ